MPGKQTCKNGTFLLNPPTPWCISLNWCGNDRNKILLLCMTHNSTELGWLQGRELRGCVFWWIIKKSTLPLTDVQTLVKAMEQPCSYEYRKVTVTFPCDTHPFPVASLLNMEERWQGQEVRQWGCGLGHPMKDWPCLANWCTQTMKASSPPQQVQHCCREWGGSFCPGTAQSLVLPLVQPCR